MGESALQLVSELGSNLAKLIRPNKDFLVKSLRQATSALSQIEQPSFSEASRKQEAMAKLEAAIKPLRKSIIKHGLLKHSDKDVRLLVAICVSEIFRILAPEPPFDDKYLRDIFKLILSMFVELADTSSPYFSRRVKILETVARCRCCVIMLDIDCYDLVLEMFNVFFAVVRDHHQRGLINDILCIMTNIINEEASQSLLDVILQNLVKEGKGAPSAACNLAVSLIQSCAEKLEPLVCGFLTSCFLDRDAVQSGLKEYYHDIMFKTFQCAPQMLLTVIPNLTQELLTDQVDVRIRAVNLTGKLFALPDHHVAQGYRNLFIEFLKRFSDKSAEVRISALKCAKDCYLANPSGTEAHEIISALEGRLLDFDDKVRTQAVIVACDLAKSNLKFVPPKLISETSERLRDKKISVRKKALQKLIEVYRDYCSKCSEGCMTISDHFEQIPCKILMLCFDKDCKEFRSQNMELVFAEDLFPVLLSVEERTRHWIHLFSLFSLLHLKALNSILSQKRRLQTEMQLYLALRKKEKELCSEELQKRVKISFMKMSSFFPDPSKAEECFHKLNQMKDNSIFNTLAQILDDLTTVNAQSLRDRFLKMIGDKHPHLEFLQSLSSKCLSNIFSSEHVSCILNQFSDKRLGNKQMKAAAIKLLLAIINFFPSFLRGSEERIQKLLEENDSISDKLIEVLAKAGPHISVNFSEFYPFLERMCLEGSRTQSKYAVSAIASLASSSEQFVFSELCKGLVHSLHSGQNVPTVLQSLGCIAQHSVSTFETQDGDIRSYIYEKIFRMEPSNDLTSCDETSSCSFSCKLKIYGLKTLVKSFLPHRGPQVTQKIGDLLNILSKMLETGEAFDDIISCESDKAHIRLAAAKSVLRLSRRWDLHISSEIFRFTILMAKDPFSFARRLFLDKTHKLLKERVIPSRYACSFAFASFDCLKDPQDDSFKYMAEFVKDYGREARIRQTSSEQGGSITECPTYLVVFLIHILAHDRGFPPEDCRDEQIYAQFCCPLFSFLQVLMNTSNVGGDMDFVNDTVLCLLCIFRAIKRAEDAVDAQKTPKVHILADIGISAVNALNHNGISSSRAPGLILLPSSLYRICFAKNNKESNLKLCPQVTLEESFVERVIHIFKAQIMPLTSTLLKHGRKHQDDSIESVISDTRLAFASCKQTDTSTNGELEARKRNAKQESSLGRGRKRAVSPTDLGLNVLPKKCSSVKECKNGPSKVSEIILEKEHLSSSGSVSLGALTDSQVSAQKLEATVAHKNGVWTISGGVTREASKHPRAEVKEPCSSKVTNDNRDVELVSLDSESWETPVEGCLADRVCGSAAAQQPKTLIMRESGKLSSRMIPPAAKARKGLKISGDTSASEVININEDFVARRTRRRAV